MIASEFNELDYRKQQLMLENAELDLWGRHDTDALLVHQVGTRRDTLDQCNHGANLYEVNGGEFYLVEIPDADEKSEFSAFDTYDEAQAAARELLWDVFIQKERVTTAEMVSGFFDDDGQNFETKDGKNLEQICLDLGAEVVYSNRDYGDEGNLIYICGNKAAYISGDPIRYVFEDESAIVEAGDEWDIEGLTPFSWKGAE